MRQGLRCVAAAACQIAVSESCLRTIVKKEEEIHEADVAAVPGGTKACASGEISFDLLLKMQLSLAGGWGETGPLLRKAFLQTPIGFTKKTKSLCDNSKQKEGEGFKVIELNASKGWFDNF